MESFVESTLLPLSIIIHLPIFGCAGIYLICRFFKYKNIYDLTLLLMIILTFVMRAPASLSMTQSASYMLLKSCEYAEIILAVITLVLMIREFVKYSKSQKAAAVSENVSSEGDGTIENQNT